VADFCSKKCMAAGFCCNDYTVGSNQMVSCAQACMMRARGSSWQELSSSHNGICKRNGRSGCSLVVNGYRYSFCSRCRDLAPRNPKCKFGVADQTACDYGASLTPTPQEYCSFKCQAAGYCCNDFRVGSNQMISCAQACMMRVRGAPAHQMLGWMGRGGLCRRTGSSGCSLTVGGHRYSFCSRCSDLTSDPKCKWGVASSDACVFGSLLPPSNFGELGSRSQQASLVYP